MWGVETTCFSQHTGGTANAVVNVPVFVGIHSRNNFYGHPLSSAVSITAAICNAKV